MHELVLEDVGGLQQVGVHRDGADVVEVAAGDRRPVHLRFQHRAFHPLPPSTVLSMSRALPTRAATASSVEPLTRSTGERSVVERSSRYSGSISSSSRAAARTFAASTSPAATVASAARSARLSDSARSRSSDER